MHTQLISLTVNGDTRELAVAPNETLLDVLRNDLGMTGTKRGCTAGSCGVCTVNGEVGEAICSCLTLAIEWDGRSVTTIEDVNTDPTEDEINEALAGAICRCTGHIKVKKAVRRAAEMLRERDAATS